MLQVQVLSMPKTVISGTVYIDAPGGCLAHQLLSGLGARRARASTHNFLVC